jgi:hypothetical protein
LRHAVSPAEWEQRIDLAACYRLIALYGWDDMIFTHVSTRVPGPHNHFLINPYGFMFNEITAASLFKIDLDGNKVADSPTTSILRASRSTVPSTRRVTMRLACCTFTVSMVSPSPRSRTACWPLSQHSILVLTSLAVDVR